MGKTQLRNHNLEHTHTHHLSLLLIIDCCPFWLGCVDNNLATNLMKSFIHSFKDNDNDEDIVFSWFSWLKFDSKFSSHSIIDYQSTNEKNNVFWMKNECVFWITTNTKRFFLIIKKYQSKQGHTHTKKY